MLYILLLLLGIICFKLKPLINVQDGSNPHFSEFYLWPLLLKDLTKFMKFLVLMHVSESYVILFIINY